MNQSLESVAVPIELKIYKFEGKPRKMQCSWTKMTELDLSNVLTFNDTDTIKLLDSLIYTTKLDNFLCTMDTISNNEAERIKKFRKQTGLDK